MPRLALYNSHLKLTANLPTFDRQLQASSYFNGNLNYGPSSTRRRHGLTQRGRLKEPPVNRLETISNETSRRGEIDVRGRRSVANKSKCCYYYRESLPPNDRGPESAIESSANFSPAVFRSGFEKDPEDRLTSRTGSRCGATDSVGGATTQCQRTTCYPWSKIQRRDSPLTPVLARERNRRRRQAPAT